MNLLSATLLVIAAAALVWGFLMRRRMMHCRSHCLRTVEEEQARAAAERERSETLRSGLADECRLRSSIIEGLPFPVYAKDREGMYLLINTAGARILNRSVDEIIGARDEEILPEAWMNTVEVDRTVVSTAKTLTMEETVGEPGQERTYHSTKGPLRDRQGKIIGMFGISRDITDLKELQCQLFQAQKMEAIGLLCGGIAHDFNNIINVIMAFTSLVEDEVEKGETASDHIRQIFLAAERAADLTRSLITFSREQVMETRPILLNRTLGRMQKLLKVLLRKDIEFIADFSWEDMEIVGDPVQMEQVMVNLTMNAVDAMPEGGRLTVSTRMVEVGEEYLGTDRDALPGPYALLTVTDTGHGMDGETRRKIFEPFFTTKPAGKGTGLGLAVSYGIVKKHNGFIDCVSEPGKGTTFEIFLPLIDVGCHAVVETEEPVIPRSGTETLLLAEDDGPLRELTKKMLEGYGYRVIAAENGEEAVKRFAEHRDAVQMAVIDLIMPKKNGRDVYREIREMRPDVKVLFISGYPDNVLNRKEIEALGPVFMTKPFAPSVLLGNIRNILDGNGA